MDRDEAIHRAEMFLSYLREEQQYQFRTGDDPDTWIDLHPYQGQETYLVRFLDPYYQFRIKPKPLDLWIASYPNGSFQAADTRPPTDTERVVVSEQGGRWIKFREVTDE